MTAIPLGLRETLAQFFHQLIEVLLVGLAIGVRRTVILSLAETEFGVVRADSSCWSMMLTAKLDIVPNVAAWTGSARHSGRIELSPFLEAMGVEPGIGRGAARFSPSRSRTADAIEHVVESLRRALH